MLDVPGVAGWSRASVGWAWLAAGCAAAPPGPRGPLLDVGAQFAIDWSVAAGNAEYREPGRASGEGSGDYYGLNFPIPPRRLEARLAPVSWADIGGDIGWIDGGVDIRFGMPSTPGRFWAANLALGMRSGKPGPINATKGTHSYWGRLEVYPLLHESHDARGVTETRRGVLAVGLNGGVFFHQLALDRQGAHDPGDGFNWDSLPIRRRELRLETALGLWLRPRKGMAALIGLEPYWLLRGDDGSGGPAGSTYRQSWGFVVVLSGSFFLRAHTPQPPTPANTRP